MHITISWSSSGLHNPPTGRELAPMSPPLLMSQQRRRGTEEGRRTCGADRWAGRGWWRPGAGVGSTHQSRPRPEDFNQVRGGSQMIDIHTTHPAVSIVECRGGGGLVFSISFVSVVHSCLKLNHTLHFQSVCVFFHVTYLHLVFQNAVAQPFFLVSQLGGSLSFLLTLTMLWPSFPIFVLVVRLIAWRLLLLLKQACSDLRSSDKRCWRRCCGSCNFTLIEWFERILNKGVAKFQQNSLHICLLDIF